MPQAPMQQRNVPRREAIRWLGGIAAGILVPPVLTGCGGDSGAGEGPVASEIPADGVQATRFEPPAAEDERRLLSWVQTLRGEGLDAASVPLGLAAVRVGELAVGTPYEAFTLEAYLRDGGSPMRTEPLTLWLTRFDCVSLVESCLAIARIARSADEPSWDAFGREMERMRYRDGVRQGYVSRLHYFSEWLRDNEDRGLIEGRGDALGAIPDERPLNFMSSNPDAYPALSHPEVLEEIAAMEARISTEPRMVIPRERIAGITGELRSGDVLAFATSIEGLDVTHAAFAYQDGDGVMRVLHAPLSGGVVEVTSTTVPEYVAAIRQSTGILVGRPLDG